MYECLIILILILPLFHYSRLQLLLEHNPDDFFRRVAPALWSENIEATAEFMNAKKENVILVPNVTVGKGTSTSC